MGVYIRDMKKPDCCYGCWALDDDGDYPRCRITDECRGFTFNTRERVMDECPLIEVKTPHGRLIDADELAECASQAYDEIGHMWLDYFTVDYQYIENAPTIIEEERE